MDRAMPPESDEWAQNTQKAFDHVAKLKKQFRVQAQAVLIEQRGSSEKGTNSHKKPSYEVIGKRRQLAKTGKTLKIAKAALDTQLASEAQRQCQPLCAAITRNLPRELRAMVYHMLIEQSNATVYEGPDGKIRLANGTSKTLHCFDPDYTGTAVHLEVLEELKHLEIRFDFGHRHGLIKAAFDYYKTTHSLDLASVATTVGVVLNSKDITGRDDLATHLTELNHLQQGSNIHVFVQARGKTNDRVARSFRRVIRATIPTLKSLHSLGHQVTIVMNPQYALASAWNSAGSRFSIIPNQYFLFVFTPLTATTSAADMETELISYYEKYDI